MMCMQLGSALFISSFSYRPLCFIDNPRTFDIILEITSFITLLQVKISYFSDFTIKDMSKFHIIIKRLHSLINSLLLKRACLSIHLFQTFISLFHLFHLSYAMFPVLFNNAISLLIKFYSSFNVNYNIPCHPKILV